VRRYARLIQELPTKWHVRIPPRFGEVGWDINGYPVNRHISFLQERVNAQLCLGMEALLTGKTTPRVLEVGGGSGEMAYTLCQAAPGITWYDCDLTQSMIYNAIHMAVWLPEKKHYIYVGNLPVTGIDETLVLRSAEQAAKITNAVVNIPHFLLQDFTGKLAIDMALNAWSFSEMPENQVQKYGSFIKDHLTLGGLLIEQNGTHAARGGCNAKEILATLFPHTLNTTSIPGFEGTIRGGPIDAWSNSPITPVQHNACMCSFDDKKDIMDEMPIPGEHYGLLQSALGPGARLF
jgi:hypothetical protein